MMAQWLKKKKKKKNLPANTGNGSLTPRLGRSLGKGNGNSLQHSCLGNPMDRGAWRAIVHGSQKSDTTFQLNIIY